MAGASGSCPVRDDAAVADSLQGDGPADDVDSDGVLNAGDNCPERGNPGQEDEDNDQTGDVCDLCPVTPLGMSDATNVDGDGVADSCDPDTSVLHRIDAFYGFRALLVPGTKLDPAANWSQANGQLIVNGLANDLLSPAVALVDGSTVNLAHTVFAQLTMTAHGNQYGFGLLDRYELVSKVGTRCHVANQNSFPILRVIDSSNTANTTPLSGPLDDGVPFRLALDYNPAQYACIELGTPQPAVLASSISVTSSDIGLHAYNANVSIDWLMIISRVN